MLLEYAEKEGIRVLIENHGGLSNDADWMVQLYNRVAHPLLGSYPDWREPSPDFDHVTYLQKVLPFAGGMSYRNQPTEALTAHMIDLCRKSGYTGWWGIESNGRDAVRKGIGWLSKYLGL
jgi:sugar phosphate isomerase/epimerase